MHKISRILTMNSTFSRVVGQCSLHGLSASRCQLKLSLLNPTAVRHNKSLHDEPNDRPARLRQPLSASHGLWLKLT